MRRFAFLGALVALLFSAPALAEVVVKISLSTQTMTVAVDGHDAHMWPVSTGVRGTPTGTFGEKFAQKLVFSPNHRSSIYGGAPMPHSIFYSGNYAIHGTMQEHLLGRRASKGCVRLSRVNAAVLYGLVMQRRQETRIVIER